MGEEMQKSFEPQNPAGEETASPKGSWLFWNEKKGQVGLAVLILYVVLLALGTIGELWDVDWILDLPLFRPPGKY